MDIRFNQNASNDRWSSYDMETSERMQGTWGANGLEVSWTLDHAASAKANLEMAGWAAKRLAPDQTFAAFRSIGEGAGARGALRIPGAILRDVGELPAATLMALKDLSDAALHGIAAGWQKLTN